MNLLNTLIGLLLTAITINVNAQYEKEQTPMILQSPY